MHARTIGRWRSRPSPPPPSSSRRPARSSSPTSRDTTSRSGSCRSSETIPTSIRSSTGGSSATGLGVVGVALRTPPMNLVLARPLDDRAVDALVAAIDDDLPGVVGAVPEVDAFATAWSANRAVTVTTRFEQRIYALRTVERAPRRRRRAAPRRARRPRARARLDAGVLGGGAPRGRRRRRAARAERRCKAPGLGDARHRVVGARGPAGLPRRLLGPDAQRHPDRPRVHPAGAPRPRLRERGHRRGARRSSSIAAGGSASSTRISRTRPRTPSTCASATSRSATRASSPSRRPPAVDGAARGREGRPMDYVSRYAELAVRVGVNLQEGQKLRRLRRAGARAARARGGRGGLARRRRRRRVLLRRRPHPAPARAPCRRTSCSTEHQPGSRPPRLGVEGAALVAVVGDADPELF